MKKSIIGVILLILTFCYFSFPTTKKCSYAKNDELHITAKSALLLDYATGEILYEKNSDERLPIASMTKLASLAVVFDYLDRGIIKENDIVTVSETAAHTGGSSAFLDSGSKYKVSDLIKTVIIASANDSTVALAEFVAGSEDLFVSKMNKFASNINLQNTNFVNSTGLPIEGHYSTASDIAQIYKSICNNEIYKRYSKIWMDDLVHPSGRKTGLVNTNRLVKTFDGIEGGKTGYTDKAKFCLTASAKRNNTRLVGVIIGASDSKTRFAEMNKLLSYGFANYETKLIVNSEMPVAVSSFKNSKNNSAIVPQKDIYRFLKKNESFEYTTDYEIYDLKAPQKKGSVVGKMFVFDKDNMVIDEVELVLQNDVSEFGVREIFDKIIHNW